MFRVLVCLALLALGSAARADTVVRDASFVSLGYCQLSVTTAVLVSTCSGGIPAGATRALMVTETAAIRWRDDGTAPTTSVGYPLAVAAHQTIMGNLPTLQVIAQTGTATVNFVFYRY
jgi:hypothetical protein